MRFSIIPAEGEPSEWKGLFPLNVAQSALRFNVGPYSVCSVQAVFVPDGSSTWGTAVLTISRSNEPSTPVALESATTIAVGGGMTGALDCTGYHWLHVGLTTPEGSGSPVCRIVVIAKGE